MIKKLSFYVTKETNPYKNLALEEYLLSQVKDDECILYLWQNRRTVVIGRNQNAWKECRVEEIQKDGGFLARRLSGGGAVFHDLGNMNFTFLVKEKDYNVEKQLDVILESVKLLGLNAEKSGRNDIIIDGAKFSGNAFYKSEGRCYHHGTIMMDVNKENLSKYLNVSKDKLQSKGIKSVKSRVVNLIQYYPNLDANIITEKLQKAFGIVYEGIPVELDEERIDQEQLKKLEEKYASKEWKFGSNISFTHQFGKRFEWGDIQIQLNINKGSIQEINIYSDGLEADGIWQLKEDLKGSMYLLSEIKRKIDQNIYLSETEKSDINNLFIDHMN